MDEWALTKLLVWERKEKQIAPPQVPASRHSDTLDLGLERTKK